MSKEKVVLSFIAVLAGLLVAGVAFYFYQSAKIIPASKIKEITISQGPTPTPFVKSNLFLELNKPNDETVVDKKIITISGKTISNAVIVVSTSSSDDVISPTRTGDFSTTVNIDDGENEIEITAIAPNGEEKTLTRTITYSTESF